MTSHGLPARSPLDGVELVDGVTEIPFLTQINLRANPADVVAMARIDAVVGATPPTKPNTFTTSRDGRLQIVWLGPDEWLVVGPPGMASQLEESLSGATGNSGSVVDVSASRVMLSIVGTEACACLERGCPIDLHPSTFAVGSCAQTILARVNVILFKISGAEYRLLVRSSLGEYLALWLRDAVGGERGGTRSATVGY